MNVHIGSVPLMLHLVCVLNDVVRCTWKCNSCVFVYIAVIETVAFDKSSFVDASWLCTAFAASVFCVLL